MSCQLSVCLSSSSPVAGGADPGSAFLRCRWVLCEEAACRRLSRHMVPANPPCVVMGTVAIAVWFRPGSWCP